MTTVRASLLLLAGILGCAEPPPGFQVVDDLRPPFRESACAPIPSPIPGVPSEVVALPDGRVLVNDAIERKTHLLGADLGLLFTLSYDEQGPLGVLDPRDLTLYQDSLVAYADRPLHRIKLIHRSGRDAGTIDLPFPPERLAAWGDGLLIASTVLTGDVDTLLFGWSPASGTRALGGAPSGAPDPRMRALANLVVLVPQAGGRALSLHQFIGSRAMRIAPDGGLTESTLPVTEGQAARIGWTPLPPFREEEMLRIATPVLDAAPHLGGEGVWILTRTGATRDGFSEKAVLRLGPDLAYLGGLRLPVNAGHLALGPDSGTIVVVTDQDTWHECAAP